MDLYQAKLLVPTFHPSADLTKTEAGLSFLRVCAAKEPKPSLTGRKEAIPVHTLEDIFYYKPVKDEDSEIPTCRHCKEPLSFKMVQTRSADEGMSTIFFCRKCND